MFTKYGIPLIRLSLITTLIITLSVSLAQLFNIKDLHGLIISYFLVVGFNAWDSLFNSSNFLRACIGLDKKE